MRVDDELSAFIAAIVLGLVNTAIKPTLVILTLPVTVLTLGFHVDGFWWGVAGALLYSVLTWAFSSLLPHEARR